MSFLLLKDGFEIQKKKNSCYLHNYNMNVAFTYHADENLKFFCDLK